MRACNVMAVPECSISESLLRKLSFPDQATDHHTSHCEFDPGLAAGDCPPADLIIAADSRVARVGPTHRRAFRVASGPIVARSAFISQHWFASERPSPSARERVLSVSIRVHLWQILPPFSSLVIFIPSQKKNPPGWALGPAPGGSHESWSSGLSGSAQVRSGQLAYWEN